MITVIPVKKTVTVFMDRENVDRILVNAAIDAILEQNPDFTAKDAEAGISFMKVQDTVKGVVIVVEGA